jgi:hypothetical protein
VVGGERDTGEVQMAHQGSLWMQILLQKILAIFTVGKPHQEKTADRSSLSEHHKFTSRKFRKQAGNLFFVNINFEHGEVHREHTGDFLLSNFTLYQRESSLCTCRKYILSMLETFILRSEVH